MTTIADLQQKYLDKVASKFKAGATRAMVSRNLKEFTGGSDVMTCEQFCRSVEFAGNALTSDESRFLFGFWDTRAGQQDAQNCVPVDLAVSDLMGSMETYDTQVFRSGVDRLDKAGGGNKSNLSSQQDGIFGGGAFAADARGGGHPPSSRQQPMAPHMEPPQGSSPPKQKPYSNRSSIEGGIFAPQDESGAPPSSRAGGNKSNRSSVEGGIFADNPAAAYVAKPNKPYSNASSIPGGIFG